MVVVMLAVAFILAVGGCFAFGVSMAKKDFMTGKGPLWTRIGTHGGVVLFVLGVVLFLYTGVTIVFY